MLKRFLFLTFLVGSLPGLVRAQVTLDTTVTLPDVTVTATRGETPLAQSPARVSILNESVLQAAGTNSVADVLSRHSGAMMKRYGPGGAANISLRGSSPNQSLILLDGHRLTAPQTGQIDLSIIPALLLESIEVKHGAGSSLYGSDGIGGVVNLKTPAGSEKAEFRTALGAGAYGEREAAAMLSGGSGAWSGLGLVDYSRSDDDFSYVNSALFPPKKVTREGADRENLALFSTVGYRAGDLDLRTAAWFNTADRGLPGLSTDSPAGERQRDEQLRFWIDARHPNLGGMFKVGGHVQTASLQYINPSLDLDQTGRTLNTALEVEQTYVPSASWLVTGGLSGAYTRADHPSLTEQADETQYAAFVHTTGRFGRLFVYPSMRLDAYFPAGGYRKLPVSPQLGLNFQPAAQWPVFLKASAGRAFRMPTFNERFWIPGGNVNLRPERGWSVDAGAFWQLKRGFVEITVFSARTSDQIVWLPVTSTEYEPQNITRVRTIGLELSARRTWPVFARWGLATDLYYSVMDAQDRSDPSSGSYGETPVYIPREQFKTSLTLSGPLVAFDVNAQYMGRRNVTSDGNQYMDPFVIINAQVRIDRQFRNVRASLSTGIENVFDAEYTIVPYYPMPPRHAVVRLLLQSAR